METKSQERLINWMLQAGMEWPKRASHAVFLPNGSNPSGVIFSTGKPKYVPSIQGFNVDDGVFLHSDSFLADWSVPNWHQTIITREMWEARDGWITWHGGECPIDGDVLVGVMLKNGRPGGWVSDENGVIKEAHRWMWTDDITAYRIHKPADVEQYEPCESVQRTIPVEPTINELIAVWRADEAAIQTATDKAAKSREAVEAALARAGWGDGEPALDITDWRDLKVGDVVQLIGSSNGAWRKFQGTLMKVDSVAGGRGKVRLINEIGEWFIGDNTRWKFIRRPR